MHSVSEPSYTSEKQSENILNSLTNRLSSPTSAMNSKQQKREAQEQAKLEAAKPAPPAFFGLFDSRLPQDDSEFEVFCEATGILQRLQQLQHQHRESDLLDLLIGCLWGPALDWFKNQPDFTSLHEFGIALTNAFPPKQDNSSSLSTLTPKSTRETSESSADSSALSREQQKLEASTSNRCQWCQLDYETYIIHRFQYPSCAARTQQAYESALQFLEEEACETFECSADSALATPSASQEPQEQQESNALKIAKKTKFNAIKNAKRAKSKALKAKEAAKPAPTVQDVGIFDPTPTCEDRRFSDAAEFLQHLQHCQRLYRESDLLILLPTCLGGAAFDIWYNKQDVMTSASLSEWIEALRTEFAIFAKSASAVACMRCDSSFNSKEKLRKHVREQHAKKFVNSSSLSDDTAKSVCETEENSAVIEAPALQAPHFLHTAPRNQVASETASPKSSSLLTEEPKVVSEFMENASNQEATDTRTTCKLCKQSLNSNRELYEHIRNHEVLEPAKDSYLSINAVSLTCKTMEKSAVTDVPAEPARQELDTSAATPRHKSESVMTPGAVNPPKDSHLMPSTPKTVSELIENTPTQCSSASPRSSPSAAFVTSPEQILEPSENQAQKPSVVSSPFSNDIAESVCEIQKNSATCRRCNKIFNSNNKLHEHIREHHARKPVKSLNPRVLTPEPTCKTKEKPVFTCPSAPLAPQKPPTPPATPRSQMSSTQTATQSLSPKCSNLSIATYKISPKSMESAAVVCPLTPSPIPPTSVRKHQEPHIQKSYLTVDDLRRTFAGKHRPFGLQQHQNRCRSPQGFGLRQPGRPCLTPSKKPYLTIENLSEMFDGKSRRKGLFQGQNNVSSQASSSQMKITSYFKPTTNQKPSVNQNSKSSKPKRLDQHMPAESIRIASRSLPEKLANLPYKSADVSCVRNRPLQASDSYKSGSSKPRTPVETPSLILVLLRLLPAFLLALAFVSAISATKTGCINAYGQAVSAIGRAIR